MAFMAAECLVHGSTKGRQMACNHEHTGGNKNQIWRKQSVPSKVANLSHLPYQVFLEEGMGA